MKQFAGTDFEIGDANPNKQTQTLQIVPMGLLLIIDHSYITRKPKD